MLAVFVVQFLMIFVVPLLLAFILTRDLLVSLGLGAAVFLIPAACAVSNLVVDETGIRFSRAYGTPKHLPWSAISSVELAPRSEVIRRGWLWPFFPYQESSKSLTSIGHYRIRYGMDVVYFPPDDPTAFLEAVRTHAPNVV
jgi:hypothetical protein